jgi:DNA-binding transcriptional LysR family regulator
MDLKQIERFVALARSLNYRRAAAELGITQSALTRAMCKLERTLGASLLTRTSRQVALTPAGRAVLSEAPRLLAHGKLFQKMAQSAAVELKQIRVGFVAPGLYRIVPAIMRNFRVRWPSLRVLLDEMPSGEQLARLEDGSLDFGIVGLEVDSLAALQHRVIARSPIVLAVPAKSSLAARRKVNLRDVAGMPFIVQSPEVNPGAYYALLAQCSRAGFTPRSMQHAYQAATILRLVANSFGVSFLPEIAVELGVQGVKYLPIADKGFDVSATFSIVWARKELPREMQEFVRMAEIAGRQYGRASRRDGRSHNSRVRRLRETA